MRRVLVVMGVLVTVMVALGTVVATGGGGAPRRVAALAVVRPAQDAASSIPQLPGGRSCFISAGPAAAGAGSDGCGGPACTELIAAVQRSVPRRPGLVLGSRCPAQAILRREHARPGLRTGRATVR